MTDKDLAIAPAERLISNNTILSKPAYLISLEVSGKQKARYFITIEKPEFENSFIQAKGMFSDLSEEEIINSFNDILTQAGKESILEMYFPCHKISHIRNLVFRANKLIKK